jgi:salicylate hydroxylase
VVLSEKLAEQPDDIPAAFVAFQNARYLRTARVQVMARVYGEFYHARGPTAELRNQMLRARTPEDSLNGVAWLYDGP